MELENEKIEQNNADLFCKFMRNKVSILNNSLKAGFVKARYSMSDAVICLRYRLSCVMSKLLHVS